jgi:peptidyl-prolyl cis-trans isomerase SurA
MVFTAIVSQPVKAQNKKKIIDKVVAIVGENSILYSDVENQYLQYIMQGYTANSQSIRCRLFEEILFAKLLLNQAQLDSVEVSDDQVEAEMDRRLQYFISQIGSKEELERYYNKTLAEIKNDLKSVIKEQIMTQQVKNNITKDIKITPTEVREYFNSIPKDSLPVIQSEIKYSVITIEPKVTAEEKAYAKNKIEELRKRIVNGEDFATLASIYSEDPGSAIKGGELGDFTRGVMYPEFEAAAFALQPDEISPVIETEAGYHILKLIKRKGEYINVRHILIQTKVSPLSVQKAQKKLDSVYNLIVSGTMTFEEAARRFSTDDFAGSGGMAINPNSGNNIFKPGEIDKDIFFQLDKLDAGQVSKPFVVRNEQNKMVIKMVKLKQRTSPHKASLKTDYDKIQEAALQKKKADAIAKWINERAAETYIIILDDKFKQCNFLYKWM